MIRDEDQEQCGVCQTSTYIDPNMKLMMGPCGHKFCQLCVNRLFSRLEQVPCPLCRITVRKSQFVVSEFVDPIVQKEMSVRKYVLSIYTEAESDFSSTAAYNAYLERIEDVVFNLVNGTEVEVEQTKAEVAEYERSNQERILLRRAREEEERSMLFKLKTEDGEIRSRVHEAEVLSEQQTREGLALERERALDMLEAGRSFDSVASRYEHEVREKKASRSRLSESLMVMRQSASPQPQALATAPRLSLGAAPPASQLQQQPQSLRGFQLAEPLEDPRTLSIRHAREELRTSLWFNVNVKQ